MKILIALFLFITFPVNAKQIMKRKRSILSDVKSFQRDGRIILESSDCNILEKQYDAIINWSHRLGERPIDSSSCFCNPVDDYSPYLSCEMDITDIVPMSTLEIYNKDVSHFGPNCFNTTLVANKILPNYRFSTPEEMEFWMNSQLCREKSANEEPEAGDVIAIRRATQYGGDEMHSFVFVTPELSFSKNSPSQYDKATLMSTEKVYEKHRVRKKCQHQDRDNTKCSRSGQVFQCQKWDDYWEDYSFNEVEVESMETLEHIECVVSEDILNSNKKYYDDFVWYNLNALLKLAEQNGSKIDMDLKGKGKGNQKTIKDKKEDFFWDSMVFRIHSLFKQLKFKELGL
jgi:hypothetical protein